MFVGDTSYLVTGTEKYVYVWDLLSCSLHRSYRVTGLTHIIQDSQEGQFFVLGVSKGTWIVQFSLMEKEPLHAWSHPQIISAAVATDSPRHSLILVTKDLETFYLSEYKSQTDNTIEPPPLDFSQKKKKKPSEVPPSSFGSVLEENLLSELQDTPSHVLPPVSLFFSDFMKSLAITPRKGIQEDIIEF